MYQVWDKDNVARQNDKRAVFNVSAKKWVNNFIKQNKNLKKDNKPLFTPTTIMETADEVEYAIVIHKAYFDSHDRVVFTVSTKEIQLANNCSKKLIKIPCGKFKNMRFDIDNLISNWFKNLVTYSKTINAVPNGLYKNDAMNGPLCWGINQLDSKQQWSFDNKFYIGVKIPYEEKFIRRDSGGPYVYTCRSYGQLTD
jgi:hypothetical protein